MATRTLWRTGKKLALVSSAVCFGGAGATIATSDDPATALKLFTTVPVRLARDSVTAASIIFGRVRIVNSNIFGLFCFCTILFTFRIFFVVLLDYEYSLWGLDEESVERSKVKHEVHLRSARKLQELCFRNGGIYIKLGQHIGQLVCSQFNRISNSVSKI